MKKNLKYFFLFVFLTITCLNGFTAEKLAGTPIASSGSATASYAFDGSYTTKFTASESDFSWVGLDLGKEYVIDRVGWVSAYGILGVFQGANSPDFSDAIPIWVIKTSQNGTIQYADVNCSRGFRYVRYVGPTGSYASVAELEFYGTAGKGDDSHLWQITNLPTVSINTVNGVIPFDKVTEISSTVIIISENGTNVLQKSETGIRERGNGSRTFPKKPWRIKFNKKQKVLNAPAEAKKWTLINNYGDKTLMRNMLAFDIARKFGMEYVPFCTPVDVILNGEYKGCYQLSDQVEVKECRVDIEEMTPDDNSGDALTGGYLVEIDAYAYEEVSWFRTSKFGMPVTIKSPDDDEITSQQFQYIVNYFNQIENKLYDTSPATGYRTIFDTESFIKHMLVNEVSGNTDAYFSTYMYKRRGNPIVYTGPVWDTDLGFENDQRTYPLVQRSGDTYLWNTNYASSADGMRNFAKTVIFNDPNTSDEIHQIWKGARNAGLSAEWIQNKVDEYALLLQESQELNFKRWPILNQRVHQNWKATGSYELECQIIKDYIDEQMVHLDKVIGFDPETELVQEPKVTIGTVSLNSSPEVDPVETALYVMDVTAEFAGKDGTVNVAYRLNEDEYVNMERDGDSYFKIFNYEDYKPGEYVVTVKATVTVSGEVVAMDERNAGTFVVEAKPVEVTIGEALLLTSGNNPAEAVVWAKNVMTKNADNGTLNVTYRLNEGTENDMEAVDSDYTATINCNELNNGEYKVTVKAVVKIDDEVVAEDEKEAGKFTTSTSGINEVNFDASNARYYNLQGIEVKNPAGGIFLKVVDGKVTKVKM